MKMHGKSTTSSRGALLTGFVVLASAFTFVGLERVGNAAASASASAKPAWVFAAQRAFAHPAGGLTTSSENFDGKQVRMITFVRPLTLEFRKALYGAGFEIFEHVPSLSFLVYGDADAYNRFRDRVRETNSVDWTIKSDIADVFASPYVRPAYRTSSPVTISDSSFASIFLPDRTRNKAPLDKIIDGQLVPGRAQQNIDYTPQRWQRLLDSQAAGDIPGKAIKAASVTTADFLTMAAEDRRRSPEGPSIGIAVPNEIGVEIETPQGDEPGLNAPTQAQDDVPQPQIASPNPATTFLGQEDGPRVGSGSFSIPPDTTGAVGMDKIFSNTNQNYRVQDKVTGADLSTASSQTFWASSGGSGFFDPRIVFDPYNERWIMAMVSNSQNAASSILVAVSQTSDPMGAYHIYRFTMGCAAGSTDCAAAGEWADFPMLGFNKNWIAVSVNMFAIGGSSARAKLVVMDYPAARTGTSTATLFASSTLGFCASPVQTFSDTEPTLYLPAHSTSGTGAYRVSTITGTPSEPVLTVGPTKNRPGGGWTQPSGEILPQNCTGTPGTTCPTTPRFIEAGDAFVRGNAVLRNGNIYYTQTVGLPLGGTTRTAIQWTRLNTAGEFVDGGRIDDPTANATTGKWYGYSSIAVNANNDMLVGFTQFAGDQSPSAGYAFRSATDAAGTTREPLIYKAGEDYYAKTFSGTRNRWGDYSQTMVDPSNDLDLWTLQEYTRPRNAQTGDAVTNNSRWGTWWAKVGLAPAAPVAIVSGRVTDPAGRGLGNSSVTLTGPNGTTTRVTNSFGIFTFTGVPIGESYTIIPRSRKFKWGPPKVLTVDGDLTGINFPGVE